MAAGEERTDRAAQARAGEGAHPATDPDGWDAAALSMEVQAEAVLVCWAPAGRVPGRGEQVRAGAGL